jgi:hypothetical protein
MKRLVAQHILGELVLLLEVGGNERMLIGRTTSSRPPVYEF